MLSRRVCRVVRNASAVSSMEFKSLALSEPAKQVLQVDINRPKKLNSMNSDFWVEWEQLFEAIGEDPEVRAVVCSAAGEKFFSAGIDLGQLAGELGQVLLL